MNIKTSKISVGLFILMTVFAISSLVTNVSAQQKPKPTPQCTATVQNVYFLASGQTVTEVYPGAAGYELIIDGSNVDKFEVVEEKYMHALYLTLTTATTTKWGIIFGAKMGQVIPNVKLKNTCTGETKVHKLNTKIKLFD